MKRLIFAAPLILAACGQATECTNGPWSEPYCYDGGAQSAEQEGVQGGLGYMGGRGQAPAPAPDPGPSDSAGDGPFGDGPVSPTGGGGQLGANPGTNDGDGYGDGARGNSQ